MKKDIALFVLIVVAAALSVGWFKYARNKNGELKIAMAKGDSLGAVISKDKFGITHATEAVVASAAMPTTITKTLLKYVHDTIEPALGIKDEQISELTRVNAQLEGKLKSASYSKDSLGDVVMMYRSKYLTATASTKDSSLSYSYNAIVDVLNYQKRNWFLGKQHNYVDVSSPDTSLKINGLEHYVKYYKARHGFLNIGLETSGNMQLHNPNSLRLNLGVNAEFNPDGLLSPRVMAGYSTNPNADAKFYPYVGVGLKANLIRL